MNVHFACPGCESPARLSLDQAGEWQCARCPQRLRLGPVNPELSTCPVCGNHELFKMKNFPHGLGMTILTLACLASVFTYGWYEKWLTWAILIGSALVDGLLYLWVGDVIVCYRCQAHFYGVQATKGHKPYELVKAERYRQEQLRREQLKSR